MILKFNTARPYSDKGQRIAAKKLPDGRVAFLDLDRMIDGIIWEAVDLAPAPVMRAYDGGHYFHIMSVKSGMRHEDVQALLQELRTSAEAIPAHSL